ncbi:MAG TPA: gluconate:H+ symporter [Chitinophagaceae bacterium]|nr:gluconate:H+ symporter [Chitinophagaceae bacterium]
MISLPPMSFVILLLAIILLVLLITWVKLNSFVAFIIVSVLCGLAYGMNITAVTDAVQKGIGDTMGSLLVIIGLGAMLGKLVADSGAAQKIATGLMGAFGSRNLVWALVLTSFIVGIPLFYNVGFFLIVPLIITISYKYKIPAVYIGLPALAAMSVTHGYLPPHPSPTALVAQYHADMGITLMYGFFIAVPAILIAGPLFALSLKKYTAKPLEAFASKDIPNEQLPGMGVSMLTAFLPVLLISLDTIVKLNIKQENIFTHIVHGVGDPVIAMTLALLFGYYNLGLKKGMTMKQLETTVTVAVKDIGPILFIIGGAGSLKEILTQAGISNQIAQALQDIHVHPLLAAWGISAIIRVCLGSATVAGLTTAGIIAPIIAVSHVNPNLMVLATGAGSLMFSHVNDGGFWMFKEYFNLSIKDTIKTWSVMETIVSLVGLAGVFVINYFITS